MLSDARHSPVMPRSFVIPSVAVVLLLAACLATAPSARAWSYTLNGVRCYSNTTYGLSVLATAPLQNQYGDVTSWYGGRETVCWRSQLQQYRGGHWYIANNRFPWLKGVANAAGILPFNL